MPGDRNLPRTLQPSERELASATPGAKLLSWLVALKAAASLLGHYRLDQSQKESTIASVMLPVSAASLMED